MNDETVLLPRPARASMTKRQQLLAVVVVPIFVAAFLATCVLILHGLCAVVEIFVAPDYSYWVTIGLLWLYVLWPTRLGQSRTR